MLKFHRNFHCQWGQPRPAPRTGSLTVPPMPRAVSEAALSLVFWERFGHQNTVAKNTQNAPQAPWLYVPPPPQRPSRVARRWLVREPPPRRTVTSLRMMQITVELSTVLT